MSSKVNTTTVTPKVGQCWRDMDKRLKARRELVLLQETTTTRQSRDKPQPAFECAEYRDGVATGKKFVVRVDRLRPYSSGYSYVGEGVPTVGAV